MHDDEAQHPRVPAKAQRRYCPMCGEIYTAEHPACPNCQEPRRDPPQLDLGSLAAVLTDLPRVGQAAALDAASFSAIRGTYERLLVAARPVRSAVATTLIGEAGEATPQPGRGLPAETAPAVAARTLPAGPTLGQWTAERQADILLYLGAFLLSIAALVFIGYQGQTISGPLRFGVLLAYTIAFLSLGFALPRWQRVREAGAVFLAVGALLVPATVVAFRLQVLGGGTIPDAGVWFAGASVTAALYLALGARGDGRFYLALGALAGLVAWGALAALIGLPVEWFGTWFVGISAATLVAWIAARRNGQNVVAVWAIGVGALGLLGAHVAAAVAPLGGLSVAQLPVAYALATAGIAANARFRGRRWFAPVPALLGLTALTACWASFGLDRAWYGCFAALAGLGYLALAEMDERDRLTWRGFAASAAAIGLLWAHYWAPNGAVPFALPATYAIALVGILWDSLRRRDAGILAFPAALAMTGSTILWAAGAPASFWSYPWLAVALALVAAEPWWSQHPTVERYIGWHYLLLLAVLPPLLSASAIPSLGGDLPSLISYAIAAALCAVASIRSRGSVVRLLMASAGEADLAFESQMLALLAAALLFAAAANFNAWQGCSGVDRAWIYLGLALSSWTLEVAVVRVRPILFTAVALAAAAAGAVAGTLTVSSPGRAALILAIAALAPAAAFLATRRWSLWPISAAFAVAALAVAWSWGSLDLRLLPLVYAACAALLSAALVPLRRYDGGERSIAVVVLSCGSWLAALGAALCLYLARAVAIAGDGGIVHTREWAVLSITLAAAMLALTLEGLRLRGRWLVVAGTFGLLGAALLAIAIGRPAGPQPYTLPLGAYLVILGMTFRRSPRILGAQMAAHEAVIAAGVLCLTAPPAIAGFSPDGQLYVLELMGEGLLFLASGFLLSARWLVAGGVLTVSAVALRALELFGTRAPYWLTLGLAGMALLGIGLLLLLQRERWDAVRERIAGWWSQAADGSPQWM
jgi:hypothetical protein